MPKTAEIPSSYYYKSPLLQAGLETRFEVSFTLPSTITNYLVLDRYREPVARLNLLWDKE